MKKLYSIFALLLVAGVASGIYYFTEYRQGQMEFPKDVALQEHNGTNFTFNNMEPKIRLIEFMYTKCPDICPNTTYQMKQLRDRLAEDNVFGSKVEFLTISFDPDQDTPDVLKEYANAFEIDKIDGWRLMVGNKQDVKKLADNFDFQYRDPGTGQFIHTSATYLLDENNKVITVFGMGEKDFDKDKVYKTITKHL
ncbi:MAG: SCO family protein [Bacillus sp. (in: firmicutes)]